MRIALLVCCYGCVTSSETLRVEPAQIDLDVALDAAAPSTPLRVLRNELDVTDEASFVLSRPLGSVGHATITSDGLTAGTATLTVTVGELTATVPVTAHVHNRRIVAGTPPGAADAFAAAATTPVDAHVDPQDNAVLPAALGALTISFAAADADDVHRVHVTAPDLDLEIVAPGAAGPRAIELSAREWTAITRTGGTVELDVASLASSAPSTQRVATEHLAITERTPYDILAGGTVGPIGGTNIPSLWRYNLHAGTVAPAFASPAGMCVGCHIAVSPDGARISAGMFTPGGTVFTGGVFDARSGAVLAEAPGSSADPWLSAAFDPGGALVTAWQGTLTVRDGMPPSALAITEAAAAPAISPDGTQLAYITLDAGRGDPASQPYGNALRIRSFSAAQRTVGPALELSRDSGGVLGPVFSSDGRWVTFGHSAISDGRVTGITSRASAVRTDGSASFDLTSDPADRLARFVSPIVPGEPVWVAFISSRSVGGATAGTQQLWLETFDPDTGAVTPAFHLPNQGALALLHGPLGLP